MIEFKELIGAGLHFGHQTARWNPKMAPYIWGQKNGIHLIDISKTAQHLEQAAKFLETMAAQGKQILWVGTKKPAQLAIETTAQTLKMPYVSNRWIGGTLTNFPQVKKSVTKLLHFEDVLARADKFSYTKKELSVFHKMVLRLRENVGGIRTLMWPVGVIVLVDVKKEMTTLKEARAAGVPVIALVDTNCDPLLIDYVIPGNDDSPKAIKFVLEFLGEATKRGIANKKAYAQQQQQENIQPEESLTKQLSSELAEEEAREQAKRMAQRGGVKKAVIKSVQKDELTPVEPVAPAKE